MSGMGIFGWYTVNGMWYLKQYGEIVIVFNPFDLWIDKKSSTVGLSNHDILIPEEIFDFEAIGKVQRTPLDKDVSEELESYLRLSFG